MNWKAAITNHNKENRIAVYFEKYATMKRIYTQKWVDRRIFIAHIYKLAATLDNDITDNK